MDRDRMTAMFKKQFELCKVKEGETMVLLSDPEARPGQEVSVNGTLT